MPTEGFLPYLIFLAHECAENRVFLDGDRYDVDEVWDSVRAKNATSTEIVDDNTIVVHGKGSTREVVERIRATRWNPPEVVTENVDVYWSAELSFEDETVEATIEFEML